MEAKWFHYPGIILRFEIQKYFRRTLEEIWRLASTLSVKLSLSRVALRDRLRARTGLQQVEKSRSILFVMDTDEILEEIGSFGFFQKRNSLLLGLIIFVLTFQTVSMVFIGGEPTWRCKVNSSVCTRNGTISFDDNYYKARCNMSSDEWEFTTEFTSIVTEVGRFSTVNTASTLSLLRWSIRNNSYDDELCSVTECYKLCWSNVALSMTSIL